MPYVITMIKDEERNSMCFGGGAVGIFLSQRKYATEILEWAGMVSCCKSCRSPVDIESKQGDDGGPLSDPTLYRSLEPHFSALKRILRYVRGTLDYGLQLFSSSTRCGLGWLPYYSEIDFRNLLRELHTPFSFARLVYCDNVSAVYLSSIPVQHRRTKHIEINIHFIRDLVAAGQEFRISLSIRCPPAPTAGE
ncbi:ribonuclease H-like domain-containing protein [Tanacetum coccineum]